MSRLLAALVVVRLLSQFGGFDLLIEACDTPCEESSSGDCSPNCQGCLCCPHQRVMALDTAVEGLVAAAVQADPAAIPTPVEDPRAHEIFHIPKRVFSV